MYTKWSAESVATTLTWYDSLIRSDLSAFPTITTILTIQTKAETTKKKRAMKWKMTTIKKNIQRKREKKTANNNNTSYTLSECTHFFVVTKYTIHYTFIATTVLNLWINCRLSLVTVIQCCTYYSKCFHVFMKMLCVVFVFHFLRMLYVSHRFEHNSNACRYRTCQKLHFFIWETLYRLFPKILFSDRLNNETDLLCALITLSESPCMFTRLNTPQLCISAIDGDLEFERSGSDPIHRMCYVWIMRKTDM